MNDMENEVLYRVVNRVGIITLNRPQALNSLAHGMVRDIAALLDMVRKDEQVIALVFEGRGSKAFCAGGDVRTLHRQALDQERSGPGGWLQFFVDEYMLDYAIHQFHKPVVALMNGVCMGGGMGLAQGARLRVVTTTTKIAMPETRIGLLPDVGATRFMARMSPALELYVGLTGVQLTGADAVYCGLADVCVNPEVLDGWESRLEVANFGQSNPLAVLRSVFDATDRANVGKPAMADFRALAEKHFRAEWSIRQIRDSVSSELEIEQSANDRKWLESVLESLNGCSPLMLAVTREALLRGRDMTLAQCFRMELNAVYHALSEGDFIEGVRALLIDKDKNPTWKIVNHQNVRAEDTQHFLSSPWNDDQHPLASLDMQTEAVESKEI